MKDVRRLYQSAMAVRNAAWLVTLAGVLLAAWKQDWKALALGYLQAGLCWLIMIAFWGSGLRRIHGFLDAFP